MSIAREFICRGREIDADITEFDPDSIADAWDCASLGACVDSIRKNDFRKWPLERLTRSQSEVLDRVSLDYAEHGPSILSSADYGRGTVALIVKHAETRR